MENDLATGGGSLGPVLAKDIGAEHAFDFPDTAMPGLGEPPWFLFMGMITIFAIGVDPVAIPFWTREKKFHGYLDWFQLWQGL